MAKQQVKIVSNIAYPYSRTELIKTPDDSNLEDRYLHGEQVDAIRQSTFKNTDTWFGSGFGQVVNILHFSDIHGDATNLARIVAFRNSLGNDFPITVLHTGDTVKDNWNQGIDFWTGVTGSSSILNVIGNHDVKSGKTAAECYERYIGPYVSGWGVTYTANLCYYYKDWADKNLRLIVLDCMHWDATQLSWLEATLASAKTAGYHVVVSAHYAPAASTGIKDCSFDTLGANTGLWDNIDAAAASAVDTFINAGGKFVCWLCGHTHADLFRFPTSYQNQLYVAVANASTYSHVGENATCQLERITGRRSEDLFNLVSINTNKQTMTITRIGADHDTLGRHIGTVVYDYSAKSILWNE